MQRCLFNLHRRLLPIDVIRSKAQEYVDAGLVDEQSAKAMVRTIELERGGESVFIERHGLETEGEGGGAAGEGDHIATKLNMRQLAELLTERPANKCCFAVSESFNDKPDPANRPQQTILGAGAADATRRHRRPADGSMASFLITVSV